MVAVVALVISAELVGLAETLFRDGAVVGCVFWISLDKEEIRDDMSIEEEVEESEVYVESEVPVDVVSDIEKVPVDVFGEMLVIESEVND